MTFKDRLTKTRETLVTSNQDNLAQAYLWVEEEILNLHKALDKGAELLKEIELAGDSVLIMSDASGKETTSLYEKARSFRS